MEKGTRRPRGDECRFYRWPVIRAVDENRGMPQTSDKRADAQLIAAMCGRPAALEASKEADDFVRRAAFHGIEPLLHGSSVLDSSPVAAALRRAALTFAAWEMQDRRWVVRALDSLHEANVPVLVFKGTALANHLYDDPALRTRADTDLIVAPESEQRATDALRRAGFVKLPGVPSYQSSFVPEGANDAAHSLDVHWRINNSALLAATFDFHELRARSIALPRLASNARGPSAVDSLLIACMHRATHRHYDYRVGGEAHHDPDRLIWLYDIHLLASRFTPDEWSQLTLLADRKGLNAIVHEGLTRARDCFSTAMADGIMRALGVDPGAEEPSRYLASGNAVRTWMDVRAMPGWRARLTWLRDTCLPPAEYMHAKYAGASGCLPCLYARRVFEGVRKRLYLSRA